MYISDMLNKSSPLYKQKEMSKSEYKKLVDRNTELLDILKEKNEEIERLNNIINEIKELCENQFIDYRVDYLGNAKKNYAPINTNEIMEIINEEF